ncbi:MAG: sigma-70 family RNA polymerase sigma factor [Verrucomicrobiales bacterium]|nr:sigma-70 family RNA polymerase sigma factor [Verrucomicrobiales bacterium]
MTPPEPESQPADDDRTESFLRLLNDNERAVSAYVHSLIREPSDAEDILQEARLVMWRHFDAFQPGTNFRAWARKIAFHQVLAHRRKARRFTELSEECLELLATELDRGEARHQRQAEALRQCVKKLSRPHRQIFLMRYSREMSIEEIARAVNRTEGAVYRLLSRLRMGLQACVGKGGS